jgi:hypothetical protein
VLDKLPISMCGYLRAQARLTRQGGLLTQRSRRGGYRWGARASAGKIYRPYISSTHMDYAETLWLF